MGKRKSNKPDVEETTITIDKKNEAEGQQRSRRLSSNQKRSKTDTPKPIEFTENDLVVSTFENYQNLYAKSLSDPSSFWDAIAKHYFYWKTPWNTVSSCNMDIRKGPISIKWFEGATTNLCYNALDRHLEKSADKVAFYWEGNDPKDTKTVTYAELHKEVCKLANVFKLLGLKKGDQVAIYMPMIIELVVSLLACSRLGIVHSVVFGGFSAESLANRILDGKPKILLTADGSYRGNKLINLKESVDEAMNICLKNNFTLQKVVVVRNLSINLPDSQKIQWNPKLDVWYHELMEHASDSCDIVWNDAEDPLFMLYTSGSTAKPKGLLHTTGGYMVYTATTFRYAFNYVPGDVYWCTADIGWITGHSYIVYGPLCNGATSVIFEGIPTYPTPERFWEIIDKYKVNIFYTAPTAIRALMALGNEPVLKYSRKTLKTLGTVGEPINPEAWQWYSDIVGNGQCNVVDTYWQTEGAGFMITPLATITKTKPGSATLPFFGIEPEVVDEKGVILQGETSGYLVISKPWPGMARTIFGDHSRFESTYFSTFPGHYATGDGCRRDADGYYFITGRVDDVLNVSGHRLGSAEIESAFVSHPACCEAAVVPCPHEISGQAIYAFVTLRMGIDYSDELKRELVAHVRKVMGPIATPHVIHWAPGLPKTRSGKIMRRILRKIADGDVGNLGDISTLADPGVVQQLIDLRGK